jgi:hypothetical protein
MYGHPRLNCASAIARRMNIIAEAEGMLRVNVAVDGTITFGIAREVWRKSSRQ